MLARSRDGGDWVKVVDFGIAKAVSGDTQVLTSPGLAVGTPRYMSPEQLTASDALDVRSDIYSLGFITFQMLTGKMPFPSSSPGEETTLQWAVRRLVTPPTPIADVKSDVAWPPRLQLVFDRALALSPTDRYGSAELFARDLVEAIDELEAARPKPVIPPSPPPARRLRPSRRVVLAVSAVAVVVLGMGMLAASLKRGTTDRLHNEGATAQAVGPARSDSVVRRDSAGGDLAGASHPAAPNGDSLGTTPSDQSSKTARGYALGKSNTRVARRTSALRDTTAVTTTGHAAAGILASTARAALDSVNGLLSGASTPTPEEATQILETLRRIRPNLEQRDDFRAQVYAAEALLVFGETAEACRLFRAVERDGVGTEAARLAQKYLYPPKDRPQLNCPP
jgi:serine/threonine-protein kinase